MLQAEACQGKGAAVHLHWRPSQQCTGEFPFADSEPDVLVALERRALRGAPAVFWSTTASELLGQSCFIFHRVFGMARLTGLFLEVTQDTDTDNDTLPLVRSSVAWWRRSLSLSLSLSLAC